MEFSYTEDEEQFRDELRRFFDAHLLKSYANREAWQQATSTALAEAGWLTVAWPEAYGGRGASPVQQLIFKEEAERRGLYLDFSGVTLIGPVLMLVGSEEQKQRHLPAIARGETRWSQGFSEPNAGSDLASLTTRAERDGDDYVVNGTKVWSSYAHVSDWMHMLVRTDPKAPKHRGISYLMVDLRTPGITIVPLGQMNGDAEFNQLFFEDVRVPVANRVGDENRGWYYATQALNFERSGIELNIAVRVDLEGALEFVRRRGELFLRHTLPLRRQRIAGIAIERAVGELLAHRVASEQQRGIDSSAAASESKVFNSELQQHISELFINLMGLHGNLWRGQRAAPLAGHWAYRYLDARRKSIGRGTNEIQRNLIATRGLGLPRG